MCPGPSLSVIGVHKMNTSSSSCHTLAADVIKWAWLYTLYLMHVLYVVYVAIGAPPPTSLVYYLHWCSSTRTTLTLTLTLTLALPDHILTRKHVEHLNMS